MSKSQERKSDLSVRNLIIEDLHVPKGRYNAFGNFHYRNAEDVLAAVKPLLGKHNAELITHEDVVNIGDRYYMRCQAILSDGQREWIARGWAREGDERKKMDPEQLTGSVTSYAKKRALDSLFLLNDEPDADTHSGEAQQSAQKTDEHPYIHVLRQKMRKVQSADEIDKEFEMFREAVGNDPAVVAAGKKIVEESKKNASQRPRTNRS